MSTIRPSGRLAGSLGLALLAALTLALVVRLSAGDVSVDFLVTSLVVALVPGTGVVYTVSSSIGGGWRRGFFAAVGCTFGVVPHILAALLGLSGVMQAGAVAFETVRWAGVAYLVFMGVSMLRDRDGLRLETDQGSVAEPAGVPRWRSRRSRGHERVGAGSGRIMRRAILLNLLNPKLTVFFLAFLPQFLDSPPGLLDPRLVGLSGIFMLMTLVVFVGYAWAAAAARERVLGAPAVRRWIQRSLGALVVGFAARLAVTDR
jgi:threonine/homoserine/homoserine lactone efflux protein